MRCQSAVLTSFCLCYGLRTAKQCVCKKKNTMERYLSSIRHTADANLVLQAISSMLSLLLLYIIQLTHFSQSELHHVRDKCALQGFDDSISVLPSCFWEMTRFLSAITFPAVTQHTGLQFLILLF